MCRARRREDRGVALHPGRRPSADAKAASLFGAPPSPGRSTPAVTSGLVLAREASPPPPPSPSPPPARRTAALGGVRRPPSCSRRGSRSPTPQPARRRRPRRAPPQPRSRADVGFGRARAGRSPPSAAAARRPRAPPGRRQRRPRCRSARRLSWRRCGSGGRAQARHHRPPPSRALTRLTCASSGGDTAGVDGRQQPRCSRASGRGRLVGANRASPRRGVGLVGSNGRPARGARDVGVRRTTRSAMLSARTSGTSSAGRPPPQGARRRHGQLERLGLVRVTSRRSSTSSSAARRRRPPAPPRERAWRRSTRVASRRSRAISAAAPTRCARRSRASSSRGGRDASARRGERAAVSSPAVDIRARRHHRARRRRRAEAAPATRSRRAAAPGGATARLRDGAPRVPRRGSAGQAACTRAWRCEVAGAGSGATPFLEDASSAGEVAARAAVEGGGEGGQARAGVAKNRARASTAKAAKSKAKQLQGVLENLGVGGADWRRQGPRRRPGRRQAGRSAFPIRPDGAKEALILENGVVGYGAGLEPLITGAGLKVSRGDRWLIVGPNGAGKSTLLRTLGGNLRLQGGTLAHGEGTRVGYFSQDLAQVFPVEETPLVHVLKVARAATRL